MKRPDAIELNISLHHKELKVKYLSSGAYASLIELKRPLKRYLTEMGEDEKDLVESYPDIKITNEGYIGGDQSFKDKLKEIQKKDFEPKELNFIEASEFKKFTDEVDFGTASTLAEYLLK